MTGVCVALCVGYERKCSEDPASCCDPGAACIISNGGVLILCLPACDPLLQDCDAQGEGCYPVGDTFQCAPDLSGDKGMPGDPCESVTDCDPGTFCGNPAIYPGCDPKAAGCCIPFCELDMPVCVDGTECTPWYAMTPPPGHEKLGSCLIPG